MRFRFLSPAATLPVIAIATTLAGMALAVTLAVCTNVAVARADDLTRTQRLLPTASTPTALRARLASYADSVRDSDPAGAAEARYEIGRSFSRAALPDSAVHAFEQAVALGGTDDMKLALVLALEARGGEGDAARAAALAAGTAGAVDVASRQWYWNAQAAWALFLAGRADTANRIVLPLEAATQWSPEWSERFGRIAAAADDPRRALALLIPVSRAARGRSEPVSAAIARARGQLDTTNRARADYFLDHLNESFDAAEARWLARAGAKRVEFAARDGFPLGGILFPATGVARPRVAVVVMAPDDSLSGYDSLAVAVGRAGLAVLLLEPRGTGHSVGAACPLPWTWRGREEQMEALVARDVVDARRALARTMPLDTSLSVVGGVGPTVTVAIGTASLDPRVRALLLVSPAPAASEFGRACARLHQTQTPVFIQVSPEDQLVAAVADVNETLVRAGDEPNSRIADARGAGQRAIQFREDPTIAARFKRWLDSALASTRSRPTPRR